MRSSVIIAIYNGEQFLQDQLLSLLAQSRKIDEFIFVDDCSTDHSISIIESIFKNKKYTLLKNPKNIGPVRSFEKGIKKATGDYIFLCDQDDIWVENKVDEFYAEFNKGMNFVFSDAHLIDENGNDLNESFIDKLNVSVKDQINLIEYKSDEVLAKRNVVSGACCAFRKSALKKHYFPFIYNENNMLHDRFLANLFSSADPSKFSFIAEKLIKYRIHENQFMGFNENPDISKTSKAEYFKKEQKLLEFTLEREDNKFFRRSHYFWYMREQATNFPFLKKFITLNTLFLEGDYKRNCEHPIREALSDLFKSS